MSGVTVGNRGVVTRTALAEAAREGAPGIEAVFAVMYNRAKATGLTMEQIATQPGQFEPHMTAEGRTRMANFREGGALWRTADSAFDAVLGGRDITNGADHFYSPTAQAALGRPAPAWENGRGTDIGRHRFFRLGYGNKRIARNPVAQQDGPIEVAEDYTPLTEDNYLNGARPTYVPRNSRERLSSKDAFNSIAGVEDRAVGGTSNAGMLTQQNTNAENDRADREAASHNLGDAFVVGFRNNPTGALANSVMGGIWDRKEPGKWDENFNYGQNQATYEEGRTWREVQELRGNAISDESARWIMERQDRIREDRKVVADQGVAGTVAEIVGNIADPVGIVATGGISSARTAVGVTPRVVSRLATIGNVAMDGAVGNVAATAIMDAAGVYTTAEDYQTNALFGAALGGLIGTAVGPKRAPGAAILPDREGTQAMSVVDDLVGARVDQTAVDLTEAASRLGPNATPEQIAASATLAQAQRIATPLLNTENPVPRPNRIFQEDFVSPSQQTLAEYGPLLEDVADPVQQGLMMQASENLSAIARANPIAPLSAGGRMWANGPVASNTLIMGLSQDERLRGLAAILGEGASGHTGRNHTAAIDAAMTQSRLDRHLLEWNSQVTLWAKENGYSHRVFQFNDEGMNRLNTEVAQELRSRSDDVNYMTQPQASPAVVRLADMLERGYADARELMVKWKTVGSEALKADRGYFTQRISAAKLVKMSSSPEGRATLTNYRNVIEEQARTIFGWDAKFSKQFSRHYFEVAKARATGGYDATANMTHHQAGDFVNDILENMRADKSVDINTLKTESEKFARGGAHFTKTRLDFDVMHEYSFKDGTKGRLLDIMETDMLAAYRNYARRAAGEIALTKFGIPGRHGVDLIRKTIATGMAAGKVTRREMKAMEQVLSEITGTPIGDRTGANNAANVASVITSVIKLGGMGITQAGESGNAFAMLGVRNTMASVVELPKMVSELKAIRDGKGKPNPMLASFEEYQGYEFGIDSYSSDRTFDVRDNQIETYGQENMGLIEKVARTGSHLQAIYSGQRMIHSAQTRGMAQKIIRRAMDNIRTGKNFNHMEDLGLNADIRGRLYQNLDAITTYKGKNLVAVDIQAGNLTNDEIATITTAINRGASQIIQRNYPGETGAWAHNDFLQLLFQFRTFSIVATEKQWERNVRTMGGMKATAALIAAMSFALPIHMARVQLRMAGQSQEDREKTWERDMHPMALTQATMAYASSAGLLGDIWDIGGGALTGTAQAFGVDVPEWMQATMNPRGGNGGSQPFIGGKIAPSFGVANDAWKAVSGQPEKLLNLLPGSAHPALAIPKASIQSGLKDQENGDLPY